MGRRGIRIIDVRDEATAVFAATAPAARAGVAAAITTNIGIFILQWGGWI